MSIIDTSMNENLEDIILFQIDRTSRISKIYSQREFESKKLGITVDQWVLLKIIHESGELSQRELADRSFRDPASITRTLDLLGKRELILRMPIVNNRRKYSICLSSKGETFVAENMDMIKRHRTQSLKGITKDELKTLSGLLQKIQANMA